MTDNREAFEAWALQRDLVFKIDRDRWVPDEYHDGNTQIAWEAWQAATQHCIDIVNAYPVPVGNSAAGEMACKWTIDALKEIRDEFMAKEPMK